MDPVKGSTKAPMKILGLFLEILPKWGLNPKDCAANNIFNASSSIYFIDRALSTCVSFRNNTLLLIYYAEGIYL